MLDNNSIMSIIFNALEALNDERAEGEKIAVGPETPMFGADAAIDSLSLVSVIVDVETAVSDALGHAISLTDDKAISQAQSPFTNPKALAAYIQSLAAD
jgi:acyl carrier protein